MLNDSLAEEKLIQGNWTNFFLFLAAHSENVTSVVKPMLAEGKTVIVDRYIDSTFAYQGLNKKLGIENVWEIMKKTVGSPVPKFTFILDIDPVIAQARLDKRRQETGEYTNFDSAEVKFHQKIRAYFHEIKELFPNRVHLIDANRTPDEVFASVMKIINGQ